MNLNDRRQSEKKEPEQSKKKAEETKNLSDMFQNSMIISKLQEVIENQKKMILERDQMIEDLKKQNQDQAMIIEEKDEIIAEKDKTILQMEEEHQKQMSESSSIISMLKSELQQKSELIEKLNSADLILKDNERLKEENEKCQKSEERTKRDCEIKLSTYGTELIDKKNQAVDLIIHLKEEESAFKERELNMDNEILIKATELTDAAELEMKKEYEIKVASIKDEYEKKKSAIYDVTIAAIIYGFVVTMLKLLSSVRMRGDISRCFRNMYLFITGMWDINMVMIENIWKMTSHQDKRIAWFVIAVFLTIIVIGLQVAIAGAVLAGIYVFLRWAYNDYKFDFPMAIVMLVTMILIVWFADKLRFISWNLIIVWIMVQLGVIMARAVAELGLC